MNVRASAIDQLHEQRQLVDIFRDHLGGDALTGVISFQNTEFLMLSAFDDSGRANGVSVILVNDISRIRWESNSLKSIAQLIDRRSAAPFNPTVNFADLESILQSLCNSCGHVTIHTERMDSEICFIGKVENIDADTVVIKEFGSITGRDSATIMLPLGEVTRVDAGGNYEKDIEFLAKNPLTKGSA